MKKLEYNGQRNICGELVRLERLKKRISQEKLAELADISPRMLSCIETGANFTQSETIENIAKALDITVQDLLRFDNPEDEAQLLDSINNKINFIKNDVDKLKILNEILQKFF